MRPPPGLVGSVRTGHEEGTWACLDDEDPEAAGGGALRGLQREPPPPASPPSAAHSSLHSTPGSPSAAAAAIARGEDLGCLDQLSQQLRSAFLAMNTPGGGSKDGEGCVGEPGQEQGGRTRCCSELDAGGMAAGLTARLAELRERQDELSPQEMLSAVQEQVGLLWSYGLVMGMVQEQ